MGDSLCDNNGMLLIYVRDKRNVRKELFKIIFNLKNKKEKIVYKRNSNIDTLPVGYEPTIS